jgi:hypothetical protein
VSERDVEPSSPEEEMPDWDFADPLKRRLEGEDEEVAPGLDPAITIPPE